MAIVYTHTRNDNSNVFYIGASNNIQRAYRSGLRQRSAKWNGIAEKHGYTVNITHENICIEEAHKIEQYLISFWREALGKENVVNITNGGMGLKGYNHTNEARKSISEKNIGNKKRLGNKQSEETKEKIRAKAIGRKHSQETKDKVSKSRIGMPSPRKGVKLSDEIKLKISNNLKKYFASKN